MKVAAEFVVSNAGLVAFVLLIIAGFGVLYYVLHRQLQRAIDGLRGEWAEEVSSLMVAARLKGEASVPAPPAMIAPPVKASPAPAPVPVKRQDVTPETLLVIAAAITAFLGKKVRVRSAKELYLHESFNSWSQQGRAVIQASHNVAQRVH
ncbi:MAG TPA: hypothetical protein VJQ82_20120 [Terriglobales bacterium]|nr:hypothetical protein [Terriglobales bacterium]